MPKLELKSINRKLFWSGIAFLVVAIGVVAFVSLARRSTEQNERERLTRESEAGPRVRTAKVARSPEVQTLALTAEAVPYASATLYAKVSGYLDKVNVDKGDLVKKGQLLAVINSPETDQNHNAAVAAAFNQRRIANRYKVLLKKKLVSEQEADQAFTNARVADAQVRQQKALKDYERILAPFDGKVTARFADPGALIQSATGGQTGALPVVTVAETDLLRIYAYVDQRYAPFVRAGLPVEVSLEERPTEKWPSMVARISGELDPKTRMLLTEVDFDNSRSSIVPGSLVKVTLKVPTPSYLEIPSATLVIRNGKSFAGVIGRDQRVELREIQIIENDGQVMRVTGALREGEAVGLDLGNRVVPGSKVRAIASSPGG